MPTNILKYLGTWRSWSVSYTHLDVYKRQNLHRPTYVPTGTKFSEGLKIERETSPVPSEESTISSEISSLSVSESQPIVTVSEPSIEKATPSTVGVNIHSEVPIEKEIVGCTKDKYL